MPIRVSVISATFNRAKLLDRALVWYDQQTLPKDEWEYLLCDDGSEDDTKAVVEKWIKRGLPIRYFTSADLGLPKEPGTWRDGCILRNALSTHARGEVLVSTHPEIIPYADALEEMYKAVCDKPEMWHTGIPYWLPFMDDDAWKAARGWKKNLNVLRTVPGLYDPTWPGPLQTPGAPDYRAQNQESRTDWESEVFWAMSMGLWRRIGGFKEFKKWGSIDMDFWNRRRVIGIKTNLVRAESSPHTSKIMMFYHQNHDGPRDLPAAHQELRETHSHYSSAREAIEAGGLWSVYAHGHRERAINGNLSTVMGDHKSRYQFAASYCQGLVVLDCPCGTGYGAEFIAPVAFHYTGIDADAESIEHARKYHEHSQNVYFAQGVMEKLDIEDETYNMIVCFEGFEHLTSKQKEQWIDEMYRVLIPGGTFILSTPQKGATGGTPWDIDMVDREGLLTYFWDGRWGNLDWFYQTHYGSEQKPNPGIPPKNAEVMILGGTKI